MGAVPLLTVIVHELKSPPDIGLTGLCAGYESEQWRAKAFATYLMGKMLEFCLNHTEYLSINGANAYEMMRKAAKSLYETDKFKNRGEFGELMLHVLLRENFNTIPAVSKIYYKDSVNATVKGFDAVHVVTSPDGGLELWLGEVKFYNEASGAIADVIKELDKHVDDDYLRKEFSVVVNKIDESWDQAERLKKLIDENTSLDDVFDALCVPVLLTYDSEVTGRHKRLTAEYKVELENEFRRLYSNFCGKNTLRRVKIHLFLVPLYTKEALLLELNSKLVAWQQM